MCCSEPRWMEPNPCLPLLFVACVVSRMLILLVVILHIKNYLNVNVTVKMPLTNCNGSMNGILFMA